MSPESSPVAAIDLGTNTVLMLIARQDGAGRLQVLDDFCQAPRLGAGLAGTGELSEAAMKRALGVLARFARLLDQRGIEHASRRVVATAVLRRARNSDQFVARVAAQCGLRVDVIAEQEEARLGHLAVVGEGARPETLIVDVGGGSTELVGRSGDLCRSVPLGAVVLTEAYLGLGGGRPVLSGGFSALWDRVEKAFRDFPLGLAREAAEVVCLGGTASNLACLDLDLARFDPAAAERHRFSSSAAREWAVRLNNLSLAKRLKFPIEAERAEILPAGLACLATALARLQAQTARVSGKGIRYGVVRTLLLGSAP